MSSHSTLPALVGSFLLCACAHQYVSEGEPSAELKVISEQSGIFSSHTLATYSDEACTPGVGDAGLLAAFSWATDNEKIVPVGVNRRLYIAGGFSQATGVQPGTTMTSNEACGDFVSFIPEVSRQYDLRQTASLRSCAITIVDRATGRAPPSFQKHGRCSTKPGA
jgi:hypothetical protein